jgi:hypothetical protein
VIKNEIKSENGEMKNENGENGENGEQNDKDGKEMSKNEGELVDQSSQKPLSSSTSSTTSSSVSVPVAGAVSRMGKRKYKDNISLSMFGTTTIAGRYKKMKPIPVSTSSNASSVTDKNGKNSKIKSEENKKSDEEIKNKNENSDILVHNFTAGQCLIRLNFFILFQDKSAVQFFSDSIKKRLTFETKKKLAIEEYESEVRRRKIDEMSNLRMLRTQNAQVLTNEEKERENEREKEKGKSVLKLENKTIRSFIKNEHDKSVKKEKEVVIKGVELDSFEALLGLPQDLNSFSVQSDSNNIGNSINSNVSNSKSENNILNNANNSNVTVKNESNITNNSNNNNGNNSNNNSNDKLSEQKTKVKEEMKNINSTSQPKKPKNGVKKLKIVVQMAEDE